MLCDMVANPRFDERDVETERGVILDEIAMYEDSADDVAADLLYAGVWPRINSTDISICCLIQLIISIE